MLDYVRNSFLMTQLSAVIFFYRSHLLSASFCLRVPPLSPVPPSGSTLGARCTPGCSGRFQVWRKATSREAIFQFFNNFGFFDVLKIDHKSISTSHVEAMSIFSTFFFQTMTSSLRTLGKKAPPRGSPNCDLFFAVP